MSKLALSALESEQENSRLRKQVYELQDQMKQLMQRGDDSSVEFSRSRKSAYDSGSGFHLGTIAPPGTLGRSFPGSPRDDAEGESLSCSPVTPVLSSFGVWSPADHMPSLSHLISGKHHGSGVIDEGTDPMSPQQRTMEEGTDPMTPKKVPPPKPPRPTSLTRSGTEQAEETTEATTEGTSAMDERYSKYITMLKMIPEGAVRQKMTVDGFTENEIYEFIAHGRVISTATLSAAAPVADERYEKYVKMQKMLPEGAVRQKMATDGFSAPQIDSFIANGPPMVAAPAPAAPATDERFEKYVKMQKMLPEGAVRQKMAVDGFTDAEISSFVANGPPKVAAPAPAAAATDERYEKYVKMQKMLPEGAVRQKMAVDGFTEAEITSFVANGPPKVAAPAPAAPAAAITDERYEKYVKMQKMLPEGAVRQKMAVDGFTEAEISSFIANGPPKVAAPAPVVPAAPAVDERYEKFVKMRKMLPEGAVRQKMAIEGFTEAEIDAFITNGPPKAAAPAPAPAAAAVEERFEKFVKMRKMLPEGAVRQKMAMEGFTEAEINLFIANGPPVAAASASTAPAAAPAAAKAPEFGERYTKFIKMKTMLPEGAVRQKMAMEGFTPSEIDVFFGAAPGTGAAAAPKGPTFTPLEAIRFAKYEKLMKTTSADQVRQKMETEEVSAEDIEKFFAVMAAQAAAKAGGAKAGAGGAPKAAPVEPPPDGMPAKPKITPVAKMKGVFWNKLKNNSIKGTVWYKLPEYNLPADEIKRLEDLFGTKTVAPEVLEAKAAKAKEKSEKKLLSLLDAQRTQNMLIVMGKVRKSPQDIMKLVLDLDPATLHPELTHTLYELHPSPDGKLVLCRCPSTVEFYNQGWHPRFGSQPRYRIPCSADTLYVKSVSAVTSLWLIYFPVSMLP
jgi:hypothetical protein